MSAEKWVTYLRRVDDFTSKVDDPSSLIYILNYKDEVDE